MNRNQKKLLTNSVNNKIIQQKTDRLHYVPGDIINIIIIKLLFLFINFRKNMW